MRPVCQNSDTKYIFLLYYKALRSYLYMSAIGSLTSGPNGRKLSEETLEYLGEHRLKSFFFKNIFFSTSKLDIFFLISMATPGTSAGFE